MRQKEIDMLAKQQKEQEFKKIEKKVNRYLINYQKKYPPAVEEEKEEKKKEEDADKGEEEYESGSDYYDEEVDGDEGGVEEQK